MTITPEQWFAQWQGLDHRLQINEYNFEVRALKELNALFDRSFETRSFGGKPWHPWTESYAKRVARENRKGIWHIMMQETRSLRASLKIVMDPMPLITAGVRTSYIHTDPAGFGGSNRNSTGMCYAALHNDLHRISPPPTGPKFERKFMGHSEQTRMILLKHERRLFDGFPK